MLGQGGPHAPPPSPPPLWAVTAPSTQSPVGSPLQPSSFAPAGPVSSSGGKADAPARSVSAGRVPPSGRRGLSRPLWPCSWAGATLPPPLPPAARPSCGGSAGVLLGSARPHPRGRARPRHEQQPRAWTVGERDQVRRAAIGAGVRRGSRERGPRRPGLCPVGSSLPERRAGCRSSPGTEVQGEQLPPEWGASWPGQGAPDAGRAHAEGLRGRGRGGRGDTGGGAASGSGQRSWGLAPEPSRLQPRPRSGASPGTPWAHGGGGRGRRATAPAPEGPPVGSRVNLGD